MRNILKTRFFRSSLSCLLCIAAVLLLNGCASPIPSASIVTTPASSPFDKDYDGKWVTVQGDNGSKFLALVMRPQGTGPFPVVVVLHGANGLMSYYVDVAERLTKAGFLTVIGCWQAGTAQSLGTKICSEATPQSKWIDDPAENSGKELIAFARSLPDAAKDRIGVYGMSRGGHAALWATSTGVKVNAIVADAPAHSPQIPVRPPKPLVVLDGLSAPLLMMHGTKDSVIPVEQSYEYEAAVRKAGKPIVVRYFEGVDHMVSVQPESMLEAQKLAIDFLRENLNK